MLGYAKWTLLNGLNRQILALLVVALCSASMAFAETPLTDSNNAEVIDSGLGGICLFCSISEVDHLVDDNLTAQTTMTLPVGVAGSVYACIGSNEVIPAGRRAGFVASLNNGLAGVLEGTTLATRLNGVTQESLSGSGSLATLIGVGGDMNVTGEFSKPFNEICYEASAVLSVLSVYRLNYAFVLEASADNTTISAQPESITANGSATATITVQIRDTQDEPISGGGDNVTLSTTAGALGAVTDSGNGTYTSNLTASTTLETAEVTGTVNGESIGDSATVEFVVDAGSIPDASVSSLSAHPDLIPADGSESTIVTVQARDAYGNDFTIGGANVEIFSTHGSGGLVNDNNDGTYTAAVASTTPGIAEITGTINGDLIGQSANVIFFDPDSPDPGTSTLDAYPVAITANGVSQATVTITTHDASGDPIDRGGANIELATTAGELANTISDHGDGSYTTLLTSSAIEETAVITARLNGQVMDETATVDFVADSGGGAQAASSRIQAMPTLIEANGISTSVITVEARDQWGNSVTNSGDSVSLFTTSGLLGPVAYQGEGKYQAILFSALQPDSAAITATLNGDPLDEHAVVVFTQDVKTDATQSTISANPDSLAADGQSTAIITIASHDTEGDPMTAGGDDVKIETTLGTLGTTITDHGDGTYTASLIAPEAAGKAIISGTINGVPIGLGTEVTFYGPGTADPTTSQIDSMPEQISANGSAQAIITITARNSGGDQTGVGGDQITVTSTAGTLASSVLDHGDGTYTTYLTSSTNEETAIVNATLNGQPISASATVEFVAESGSSPDPATSLLWSEPTIIASNGADTASVHVQTRDAWGNPLATGGNQVTMETTLGTLGPITDHGDGNYTSTLSGDTSGFAEVTGTLNGEAIAQSTIVELSDTVGPADAGHTIISANPDQLPPDGSSITEITVQVNDANGDPVNTGGDKITLETTLGTLGATVTDHDDGTYSSVLVAPASPGVAIITGTLNGEPISGHAIVTFGDVVDGIFQDRFEQEL